MTETTRKLTRYRVLRLSGAVLYDDDGEPQGPMVEAWVTVCEIEAHGEDSAKQRAADEHGAGTYVACPARSWKPTEYASRTKMVPVGAEEEGS